jgi:hypothetical protein
MHNDGDQESRKRARAYEIWEQEARPEGRHEEHWVQAERELRDEGSQASAGITGTVAASPTQTQLGDEAPPGTPGTGENTCPTCRGSGKVGQNRCADCGGTGKKGSAAPDTITLAQACLPIS